MSRLISNISTNRLFFENGNNQIFLYNQNGQLILDGPSGPVPIPGAAGGSTGFTGSQGDTGYQGPQGAQGFQGFSGPQGATGFRGVQGFSGGGIIIESVTGSQPFNPEANTSIFTGQYHSLTGSSTVGFLKTIINNNPNSINPVGGGLNESVDSMVFDTVGVIGNRGNLYIGGGSPFRTGGTAFNRIVGWNGSNYFALGEGVNSGVNDISIDTQGIIGPTGNLYLTGSFTTAGGATASRIARWNGSGYTGLGAGLASSANTLKFDTQGLIGSTGHLYVGGSFTTAGGSTINRIARWNGSGWTGLGSGIGNQSVNSIEFDPFGIIGPIGNLYTAGNFTVAGGVTATYLARWNGSNWFSVGTGLAGTTIRTLAFDTQGIIGPTGNLYIGGVLTYAENTRINNICRWDGNNYIALGNGLSAAIPDANSSVITIAFDRLGVVGPTGYLYAGGDFQTADGINSNHPINFARWDGNEWTIIGGGLNRNVNELLFDPVGTVGPTGNLYVGGDFTSIIPANSPNILRYSQINDLQSNILYYGSIINTYSFVTRGQSVQLGYLGDDTWTIVNQSPQN